MSKIPDLSVVIVSHNHASCLSPCVTSLEQANHRAALEVFMVDNVSTDGSAKLVRDDFPWVTLLENQQRHGFATTNTHAVRQSQGRYALILNPDTEVSSGALDSLIAFADADPVWISATRNLSSPMGVSNPPIAAFLLSPPPSPIARPLRKFLWNSSLTARHLSNRRRGVCRVCRDNPPCSALICAICGFILA